MAKGFEVMSDTALRPASTSAKRTTQTGPLGQARLQAPRLLLHGVLLLGALLMVFPFYWMLTTSVKGALESKEFPPTLIPHEIVFSNFAAAWNMAPFARYFLNSAIMAGAQVVLVLVTSTLAAYAFARFDFTGKRLLFMGLLATMMVPFEVTLVPNFIILKTLGWYNSYLALTVPFGASAFAIFLLRQFFLSIPRDLSDAAQIDGAGEFGFFWHVALPLSRPALLTIGLLTFVAAWNSLLWPLMMTSSEDMRVVQVGLSAFQSEAGPRIDLLMAASTLSLLPVGVLYFFAQRYFVDGISRSGITG